MAVARGFDGYAYPEWYSEAACQGQSDLFLLVDEDARPLSGLGRIQAIEQATAICDGCPVRLLCRDHGISVGEQGVWGGLSQKDLRGLHKRRKDKR